MQYENPKYKQYHLINEMFETISVIENFNPQMVWECIPIRDEQTPLMLTGEGSSRIFPARNLIHHQMILGKGPEICSEGATQLLDYPLKDFVVIGASNSGKTKEIVRLFNELSGAGHPNLFAVTCNKDSLLEKVSKSTFVIENCHEKAVAATKSVVAQALTMECLLWRFHPYGFSLESLAQKIRSALEFPINDDIINAVGEAGLYFVGLNNGVAEELALKTNEILRKKSAFLPGTYLLHGIEEVINSNDLIIMVDPIDSEAEKVREIFLKNIGCKVITFNGRKSNLSANIDLPGHDLFEEGYIKLAMGWNLLAETGVRMNIDIDNPARARKVGNEFTGVH